MLLLPDTDQAGALEVAEKVRHAIAQLDIAARRARDHRQPRHRHLPARRHRRREPPAPGRPRPLRRQGRRAQPRRAHSLKNPAGAWPLSCATTSNSASRRGATLRAWPLNVVAMRVVIVGAGTFGASLAWVLAGRGEEVVLVDQFEPGDVRATSGGETRLIRCTHGANPDYAAMARRAWTLWRELETQAGAALLTECGVSWFAHRDDGWEAEQRARTARAGHPDRTLVRRGGGGALPVVRRQRSGVGAARARGRGVAGADGGADARGPSAAPMARR